jgi:CDGSH-type Zn-finger protein
MSNTNTNIAIIRVLDKGPLHVRGHVEIFDAVGNRYDLGEQFTLCRCGRSESAPFCDGSHRMAGFASCPRVSASEKA